MIVLTLPLPPSVNACWANVPGKGRVRTKAYRDWIRTAGWEATIATGGRRIVGAYRMRIEMSAPRMDIGNCEKPIGDLLQSLAIVENDRLMSELHVVRAEGPRGVRVEIEAL